ncbi:MAG TPA: protein kinase [Gemmatimonadales bacterium]|nr:protein kinase [Gemmatimonadales bacterium]
MPELQERLEAALGAAYRLERELGGGGMSRVYLAEETALGRRVVVKVLPPDLAAGLNAERFRREIQLAAKLQHPHIVPVLAAGRAGELLYYTMPFIEGESLRARLAREGELPVTDAVRLLRDVADALAYAHEHGVVHRDIKPGNVMVSRHHALVTDFGVAKAVSEAASGEPAGGPFTSAGVAMGTPAYMAPEQAAADPAIDHRADIYSVGVMAYEMLAGHTPFTGRTPQQLLAAQVNRTPEPLESVRPSAPPELAAVVMRCLEKRPADRWQSADELLRALEAVATPGTGTVATTAHRAAAVAPTTPVPATRAPRRRRVTTALAGAGALGVLAIGLHATGIWPGRSLMDRGLLSARERIIVSEFRSPPADSVLGGAITEAFRIDLAQSPTVTVLQPDYVQQTLARMRRDPKAPLDPEVAREIAIRDGIKAYVAGEVVHAGTGYVISTRLISSTSGDALVSLRETADDSTRILSAIDRLSKAMRQRIGESLRTLGANEPLEQVSTGSLAALRKYSLALTANREGDTERAIALLREAIGLDSGFAMAYRKLGVVLSNSGARRSEQVDAFARAYQHRDRLTDRERYLTEAAYAAYVTGETEKEITAYRSLLDLYPNDTYALNNLSIVYTDSRNYAEAENLARRAVDAQPNDPTFYLNLMSAQASQGKLAAARATLDTLRSRVPGTPYAALSEAGFAVMGGDYDSAEAVLQQLQTARRESAGWRTMTAEQLGFVAAARGRLTESAAEFSEGADAAASLGQPQQVLMFDVARAGIDLWFRGARDRAVRVVDAALERHPLASFAPADRPYIPLATFYAEAGRPDRARALLADFDRTASAGDRRLAETERHVAMSSIALAERRPRDAIAELREAGDDKCAACRLPALGRAYEAAGEPDSAIAAYQRYVTTPFMERLGPDAVWLPWTYLHLGGLYEERGDRARAADNYGKFVRLWKGADPELMPKVADARRRLAALTGERATT